MTDGISSALVSPLARHASVADRNALPGNDEQSDFDSALMSPKKDDQPKGADATREKGLHKFAERLAAPNPHGAEDATTAEGDVPADAEPAQDAELPLPDAPAKDVSKADAADVAMPLVLALSELRKAGSQPANAAPANATDADTGDATLQPDISGDVPKGERSALVTSARTSSAATSLPPGLAPASEATTTAQPGTTATANPGDVDTALDKPARPTAKQADQPAVTSRVSVISEQAIPAPASSGANSTTGALALEIASAAPRHTAAASAVQQLQSSATNAPAAQVLKIQLRPVELGMVTANLHLAGQQLSVEIQVENAEAYHRLSADREAINTALRGLGFDVDRVTILQPQSNASAQARGDGDAASQGSGGRDQPSFQPGGTGSEGGNTGNGRNGGRAANEDGNARNISSPRTDRADSSRYI
ncbi:flagellar hook-length control protein FliK [Aminobacter sp. AP02]|uniref:flagellar hook-length control protein FliK n=1 Tax=Aminobacter sp. AP02 TaxID=2135737 RepID=UPI000D6BB8D8|nr:flagellar hook-length control protein FliK [Aminobacter sp. AP02]PWK71653.1 chemotaxis protein MotD [Aminobacter sp. AP02]